MAPKDVFDAAASWIEICDWIPAVLTGELSPQKLKRSVCAAGHKAMFNPAWQGLPDGEFLEQAFAGARVAARATVRHVHILRIAAPARFRPHGLASLGFPPSVAIAVGAFDAHMGAVGAGFRRERWSKSSGRVRATS